jgi:hypothetical protein
VSANAYLPCFTCGKVLPNVCVDSDNQPYGGTEFTTEGHYGSTFWDSFDGEGLVLNICDDCLRAHTDRLAQRKMCLPVFCEGIMVGRLPVERPLVAYTGNSDSTKFNVDVEELGLDLGIDWHPQLAMIKEELSAEAGDQDD